MNSNIILLIIVENKRNIGNHPKNSEDLKYDE